MKKVIIVYDSRTGHTEEMAQYIAEGLRFSGTEVELKKVNQIKKEQELEGYDGYIFGSPTYHKDMIGTMKTFLFLAQKAPLRDKLAGAFGSSTHSGEAPKLILDTMEYVFKMRPFSLGPFKLTEDNISTREGLKACQDYGKAFGEELQKL